MGQVSTPRASTLMVILAFAIVYIVWGSTYIFIKIALQSFPPFILGAFRFLATGLLMMLWNISRGEKLFVANHVKHAFIGGVLMLFVGNGAVVWVEQYLPSAMVAIIISSSPIYFVLLDKPKWKENFTNKGTIAGLLIGFGGVILLFGEKLLQVFSKDGNRADLAGMGILIVGAMAWAGGSLWSKYKSNSGSPSVNTAWQMLAAGFAFLPISLLRGETTNMDWQGITTNAWLAMAYLVVFGSIAGFTAYVWLLKVRSAMEVSTYAYVNPVVALLLGIFFANENISLLQVAGLVIILGSVFMINIMKYRNEHRKTNIARDDNKPPDGNLKVINTQLAGTKKL